MDSDNDGIADDSDAFPNDSQYQADSDSDGLPDQFEDAIGLNPNDPADAAMDLDNDGSSNLEEFLAGTDPQQPSNQAPTTPDNLNADIAQGSITLSWNPSQDDTAVVGYRVYRNGSAVADVVSPQWTDTVVQPDTVYSYAVAAYDGENALSATSAALTVNTPAPVVGDLAITAIADQVAVQGSSYQYQPLLAASTGTGVRWVKEYGPDALTVNVETGAVQWQVPGDLPDESFHIGVKAIDGEGNEDLETWVLTVGSNPRIVYAGPGEAYTTVADGVRALQSGDTLIIRNGTYIGDNADFINKNGRGGQPVSGTADAFTTIIAEDPGQVILDGRGVNTKVLTLLGSWQHPDWPTYPIASTPRNYIAIKGVHVHNVLGTGVYLSNVQHVKLIDIGVSDSGRAADCRFDASGDGGRCGSTNIYVRRSEKVLLEDVYTYGHARYQIIFRKSRQGIARRAVSRIDGYKGLEPVGAFQTYCSQDVNWQNSIVVDSDSEKFWVRHQYLGHAFGFAASDCQSYDASNSTYHSGIALNNSLPFSAMNHNRADSFNYVKNSVGWGGTISGLNYGLGSPSRVIGAYGPMETDQLTLGRIDAEPKPDDNFEFFYHYTNPLRISNSIIFQLGWDNGSITQRGMLGASPSELTFSHNNYFENGITSRSPDPRSYSGKVYFNNDIAGDPRQMGLSHLPRIDEGSFLETAGEGGKRVGAHIVNRLGVSGTFHGESGWDQLTDYPLWPYPHEGLIKTKMANYSYTGPTRGTQENTVGPVETLEGARGFAADETGLYGGPVTLTSYIWEQLGVPCPEEICLPYGQ